jgi:hypothetical protein
MENPTVKMKHHLCINFEKKGKPENNNNNNNDDVIEATPKIIQQKFKTFMVVKYFCIWLVAGRWGRPKHFALVKKIASASPLGQKRENGVLSFLFLI